MIYNDKITQKKSNAAAGNASALPLQDGRPQSVLQKKQVETLSNAKPVQRQANKTGLPDNLRSGIENLSGHAMDDVNVHYNSDKPAQLNAHAYAQGTDIHIASGQEKHLPHEAWHVVQQKQGRVKPTMQMKGKVNVNDDTGLEKEADVMGAKAVQTRSYAARSSAAGTNTHAVQLKSNSPVQLNRNKQGNQSQKAQRKYYQQQQRKQNAPAPKKSGRAIRREEERAREKNATRGGSGSGDMTLSKLLIYSLLFSTLIHSVGAQQLNGPYSGHGRNNRGRDDFSFDDNVYHSGNSTSLSLNRSHDMPLYSPTALSSGLFNHTSTALVHDPIRSTAYNTTNTPPVKEKSIMAQMPVPRSLHVKKATLGQTAPIGAEAGASNGLKAKSTTFSDGRQWGTTYLKGSGTNHNTDNSTVRASHYNSQFLRSMGVAIPEIETIESVTGHQTDIASRDIGEYRNFKSITNDLQSAPNFNAKQREDYVKLALLSPVADLHKKNFGLINGTDLGTIDVDTALPMHSHNYRRLIDRFELEPEGYKTNDMSGSFLGEGKIQDNVFYNKIDIKEADVVNAVKAFCSISVSDLAEQLQDYPLQGKASQKLTLQSLRTQQEMFREAFDDFKIEVSEGAMWVGSDAYTALKTTIEKYEEDNRFPYSFEVADKGNLKISVNKEFARKKGTGFWEDKEAEETNPQLIKAAEAGHLGDVNMRLSSKTNINPADIPSLLRAAKPYLRSIGAGNQGVSFVVNLVHHPSFNKMSSDSKDEAKKIFADVARGEDGNPYRQALFPKSESGGHFKVDSYYDGGSEELRDAVEKIKKL